MNDKREYMTVTELAALVRQKPQSLRKRRMRGDPPAFVRIGNRVLYARAVVEKWIAENVVEPEPRRSTFTKGGLTTMW